MPDSTPLFSVIIPTHNRAQLLKRAIQSVVDQSVDDWQLIIVDDGSTDETRAAVSSFSDSRIRYYFQEHGERSAARNKGIELAQGHYVCFIDDDDYLMPQHLEVFKKAISKDDPKPPILRVGYYREKKGEKELTHLYNPKANISPAHYAALNFCGVWSLAIPRAYLQTHQFPPEFRHWQDTHLIIRLLALHPFLQLNEFTYVYRIHEVMGSRQLYKEADARARIESNVAAIRHLFKNYPSITDAVLPADMQDFLVSQKYSDHAHGAVITGNLGLAWEMFLESWKNNSGGWFYWKYFKILLKMPLKWLVGYPKLS